MTEIKLGSLNLRLSRSNTHWILLPWLLQ
uniref:Uncharacterized protein n=1 Tax=Rhizophora mucronata TaxID=61149 RepID=A0A2P2QU98_RHIMU